MNVLIVGASGVTGIAVQKELAGHGHQLRCLDLAPPCCEMRALLELLGYDASTPKAEWLSGDITDPAISEAAVKGMDACVYVALALPITGDPSSQYSVNVIAPHYLAEACARLGVRKLVYASSVSVNNVAKEKPVTELDPPRPWRSDYAMSKWLAEEMLRLYAQQGRLNSLCLRLGTIRPHVRPLTNDRYYQYYIDVRDAARAFRLGVEDTRIKFDVLHVVSQGEPMCCSPARAKEVLGFEARYNGREHFAELRRKELEFQRAHPAQSPRRP